MADDFPDTFYRGLKKDGIDINGYVTAAAFKFEEFKGRVDDYCELSINWNDDENSIERLKKQHKPFCDSKQFYGCTYIETNILNGFFKNYIEKKIFNYERAPIEENIEADIGKNQYHGNLLLNNSISSQMRKNIQHSLATLAGDKLFIFEDSEDTNNKN